MVNFDNELLQILILEAFSSTCALLEVTKELPEESARRGVAGRNNIYCVVALEETMPQSWAELIKQCRRLAQPIMRSLRSLTVWSTKQSRFNLTFSPYIKTASLFS